jgi:ABC-type multidrug transport system ATPase subunit
MATADDLRTHGSDLIIYVFSGEAAMIEVRGLTKKFGSFTAVDRLSFSVGTGETFALLGPNGSGKSTVLKCLAGLTVPTSGEIQIGGIDALASARESRKLLSYMPQRVRFHECFTAFEVLDFYRRLRKLPKSRIDAVLHNSEFDFNGYSEKYINELSGGMVQKLGLAVTCLPDAPLMLLDEPTVSLDPKGSIAFRRFLRGLKDNGKTIVFTSHVLADVEEVADRVAIMVGGRLVAVERIEDLRAEMKGEKNLEEVYLRYAEAA